MRRVAGDLTVRPDQLDGDGAAVAERDGRVLGYYLLLESRDGGRTALLDSLFIDPDAMGGGVGRALVAHALALAARRGVREVVLDSDPFAEPFYAHLGARRVGESPSGSVPGRSLPRMAFTVPAGADVGAAG
jgi:GNAT superfamily N-acetyltransferase